MSDIYTVGISYRTAPVMLRELIATSADGAGELLRQLAQGCRLTEAAILSTCNRTEIYCLSDSSRQIADWFSRRARGQAEGHIYQFQSENAVRHLFRVASGLDSQLLGEPEVTGQVKQFAALARQAGFSGTVINRLMEHALAAAKAVRAQTEIGRHSLSYPALALRAAAGIFPNMRDIAVLFVGAGDMTRAGMPIFADHGARRMAVAGRNSEKTAAVAASVPAFQVEAYPIARLPEVLPQFDVVVSSTASQLPVIGKGAVESALRQRHNKPMMFADLAVPRDLEAEIKTLPEVFVYDLDQFGAMADESSARRQQAAKQGEIIIARRAEKFMQWLRQRKNSARVTGFRAAAARIREEETQAALAQLAAGAAPPDVVRQLSHRLCGRLTHAPTEYIKQGDSQTAAAEISPAASSASSAPASDAPGDSQKTH